MFSGVGVNIEVVVQCLPLPPLQATHTHCEQPEFAPSISSVIGSGVQAQVGQWCYYCSVTMFYVIPTTTTPTLSLCSMSGSQGSLFLINSDGDTSQKLFA